MTKPTLNEKNIIFYSFILTIIIAPLGIINDNFVSFALGLMFGYVFGVLSFRLLKLHLTKAVTLSPAKANTYMTSRYFIRMIITGLVLYVSFTNDALDTLGVIIGLLTIKAVIYILNILDKED